MMMRGQRLEVASATDSNVLRWVSSCLQAFAPLYLLVDALLLKPALCMYTICQKWLLENRWDPRRTHPSPRKPSFTAAEGALLDWLALESLTGEGRTLAKRTKVNFSSQSVGIFHCPVTSLQSFYMYKPISICKYICIYWHQGEPSLVVIYHLYVLMFLYSWGYVNSFESMPKAFFFLFYLSELRVFG